VRSNLRKKAGVTDALVHIDAEDDVYYRVMDVDRDEMEKKVRDATIGIEGVGDPSEMIIHLLNGKVLVDFNVALDDSLTIAQARGRVNWLKQKLVADGTIDLVVIRSRLTDGAAERDFYSGGANKKGD
ncbi:MAG: hypothetical protein HQK85_10995, partial [Nitrospinae bacterium]|nr:hypothetical protein [Nitrospinota bacterium]